MGSADHREWRDVPELRGDGQEAGGGGRWGDTVWVWKTCVVPLLSGQEMGRIWDG